MHFKYVLLNLASVSNAVTSNALGEFWNPKFISISKMGGRLFFVDLGSGKVVRRLREDFYFDFVLAGSAIMVQKYAIWSLFLFLGLVAINRKLVHIENVFVVSSVSSCKSRVEQILRLALLSQNAGCNGSSAKDTVPSVLPQTQPHSGVLNQEIFSAKRGTKNVLSFLKYFSPKETQVLWATWLQSVYFLAKTYKIWIENWTTVGRIFNWRIWVPSWPKSFTHACGHSLRSTKDSNPLKSRWKCFHTHRCAGSAWTRTENRAQSEPGSSCIEPHLIPLVPQFNTNLIKPSTQILHKKSKSMLIPIHCLQSRAFLLCWQFRWSTTRGDWILVLHSRCKYIAILCSKCSDLYFWMWYKYVLVLSLPTRRVYGPT